jgi:hypothetical protein
MDLSNAIAAEAGSTDVNHSSSDDDGESEIPFEANESTEGYALFGNSAKLVEDMTTKVFDQRAVYEAFDIEWEHDLSDYEMLVEEADDPTGQEKLMLLHNLAKSTFGDRQSQLNEGYGMGWDTNQSPPKVYDNEEVDHVPYLDVFSDLPAFEKDTLDAGEIDQLESEGLDMKDYGFDRSVEGPQLPVLDGERVPILLENGDEVVKTLKMFDNIDWDEVTYCPKDGELQGTPSLGPSEGGDTEKAAESSSDDSDDEGDINLAANPEAVTQANVSDIKAQSTDIDSLRTIKTMLRVEKENENRSSAIERLEQRRSALQDGSDDEEADTEEADSDDDSDDGETVDSVEEVKNLFGLSDLEADAVQYRVENGKADSYREAAQQVSEL